MFKSAATKIAHNSTIPALSGNKDLRLLQDLIIAEKSVLNSLDKLAVDFAKASDALRSWGLGEGDDLGDVLSASASLLLHFPSSLSRVATHEQTIRENMKSIRTREEALDALKRRRKSLLSKADAAERKLAKMGPEHKNLQMQTEALNKLRDEIREVDSEIMGEEAGLGDFKRWIVKEWMGLKFGGLGEFAEKTSLVSHFGKQLILRIPQDTTEPGLARTYYSAQDETRAISAEADRAINDVVFSVQATDFAPQLQQSGTLGGDVGSGIQAQNDISTPFVPMSIKAPTPLPPPVHPSVLSRDSDSSSRRLSTLGPLSPSATPTQTFLPPPTHPQIASTSTSSSYSMPQPQVHTSGDMKPDNYSLDPIPVGSSLGLGDFLDDESAVNELGAYSSGAPQQSQTLGASGPTAAGTKRGGRFATFPVKGARPLGASSSSAGGPSGGDAERNEKAELARRERGSEEGRLDSEGGDHDPAPAYTPPADTEPGIDISSAMLQSRDSEDEESDEFQLAYMSPGDESPIHTLSGEHSQLLGASLQKVDRRVRFKSGVSDVQAGLERREEEEMTHRHDRQGAVSGDSADLSLRSPYSPVHSSPTSPLPSPGVPWNIPPPPPLPAPAQTVRIPTPPQATLREQDRESNASTDEKSLNAAAAREISRELDALLFSPPPPTSSSLPPPSIPRQNGPPSPSLSRTSNGAPSPLVSWSTAPSDRGPSPPPSTYSRQQDTKAPSSSYATTSGLVSPTSNNRDRSFSFSNGPKSPEPSTPRPGLPLPSINLPSRSASPSISSSAGTPYRTPPEYPRGASSTSTLSKPSLYTPNLTLNSGSTLSLGGTTSAVNNSTPGSPTVALQPPAPGTRTISASAFRRQMRSPSAGSGSMSGGGPGAGSLADTSPLSFVKRSLPSSPYPSRARGDSSAGGNGGGDVARGNNNKSQEPPGSSFYERSLPAPPGPHLSPQNQGHGQDTTEDFEDQFDYISAYVNGVEEEEREAAGGGERNGYAGGRFATNLENEGGSGLR